MHLFFLVPGGFTRSDPLVYSPVKKEMGDIFFQIVLFFFPVFLFFPFFLFFLFGTLERFHQRDL